MLDDTNGSRPTARREVRQRELHAFAQQLREARARIAGSSPAEGASRPPADGSEARDAGLLLEELNVAEEELHAQHDEIVSSRERVEEERSRYAELFELAPDAYVVTDAAGTIQEANQVAQDFLGLRPDRRRRRTLISFVVDPARRRFRQQLVELEARCERTVVELALRARHGRVADVEATVAPIVRQGRCAGHRWLLRDVTAQRLIERENAQLRAHLEETVEQRTAELAQALDGAKQSLETAYEELQSTNEELETTNEELETMNEELHSMIEELRTINDEMRRRGEELNELNAFLEAIYGSMRGGVVVLDRDLRVTVWSAQSEEFWGVRASETIGTSFLALDIGLPVEALAGAIRSCLAGQGDVEVLRIPAVNRRGRAVQMEVTCVPLRSADRSVRGAILTMQESSAGATRTAS